MRILLITQYFWPESFRINDIVLGLAEKGHSIEILTGQPNYPSGKFYSGYGVFKKRVEFWNGIKIHRTILIPRGKASGIQLFFNYFSFAFFSVLRLFFISAKFDKIFVYEPSPITVGIPAIFAKYKFKAPVYFWVQDLWPESISAAGGVSNLFFLKIIDWLTRFIYKSSTKILVQSKAFIPYILDQDIDRSKLIYYPNSTESYFIEMDPDQELLGKMPTGIKLMFAGNIGESQSFVTLLQAAEILKNENVNVHWIILGEGRMKEIVIQQIQQMGLEDCFHLMGSYPPEEMPKYFSCADAMIVSLKKSRVFAYTIPSKIQSYLACGKPIITSLDGEGSRIINEAKAGLTSPSEDPTMLANNIKNFIELSEDEKIKMGQNARKYYDKEFERGMLLDKLEMILENDNSF